MQDVTSLELDIDGALGDNLGDMTSLRTWPTGNIYAFETVFSPTELDAGSALSRENLTAINTNSSPRADDSDDHPSCPMAGSPD